MSKEESRTSVPSPEKKDQKLSEERKTLSGKKIVGLLIVVLLFLAGFFYWQRKSFKPSVAPPADKELSKPKGTPFPPPDWKNYRRSDFAYSIFYPPDWQPREQGRINDRTLDVVSLIASSEGRRVPVVQIKVSSLPYQEELTKRDLQVSGFSTEGRRAEKIFIDDKEGVRVIGKNAEGKEIISVFLPGKDKTFILLGSPEAFSDQTGTNLVDQVISTFEFP